MEDLRINCPKCKTNYLTSLEEITVPRPEYDCGHCGSRFGFDLSLDLDFLEVPTYLIEKPLVVAAPSPVLEPTVTVAKIPEKVTTQRLALQGTPILESLWCSVLDDYSNLELHAKFLDCAYGSKRLAYASQQYHGILAVTPHDEIAREMNQKIISMAESAFVRSKPAAPPKTQPVKRRSTPMINFFLLLGILFFITGFVNKNLKHVTAAGAAIIVLMIGFKMLLPKSEV